MTYRATYLAKPTGNPLFDRLLTMAKRQGRFAALRYMAKRGYPIALALALFAGHPMPVGV